MENKRYQWMNSPGTNHMSSLSVKQLTNNIFQIIKDKTISNEHINCHIMPSCLLLSWY